METILEANSEESNVLDDVDRSLILIENKGALTKSIDMPIDRTLIHVDHKGALTKSIDKINFL